MPNLDDVRGVALATLHALTTATMIIGVPVLVGHRFVSRRGTGGARPVAVFATATLVGTGLTVATQRAAWAIVRLWLRMDEPDGPRFAPGRPRAKPPARAQPSGR